MTKPRLFQGPFPGSLLVIGLMLGLSSLSVLAADSTFDQGLSASRNNDYPTALRYFLQARDEGMDSAQLHYNIGVSHFKLGQYDEAAAAFVITAQDESLAGLAYYNLALIAQQQNQPEQSRQWLQRCRDHSPDARLLALADALESRLEPATSGGAVQKRQAISAIRLVSLNGGYDDNVTLHDDNNQALNASGQSDQMIEFLGFYQQQRPLRDTLHLSLDASLYQQDYLQLNNYDVGLIRVGGVIARDISPDWQWQGDSHISNTFIAGSSSSRTLSLQGGLHRQLAGVRSGIDIQITRIEAQDIAYDQLTGWQYELITRHSGRQADWKYDLGAQFAINDRADYLTATRFSSYSPRRLTLSGKIQAPLTSRLDGALKLDWRHSRYRDADLLADSSLLRREEQRWRLTADLKHPLNRDTDLRLQYRYSRNESNLTGYDYRRNQIQLGVMFSW